MKKIMIKLSWVLAILILPVGVMAAPPLITSVNQIAPLVRSEIVDTAASFVTIKSSVVILNADVAALKVATSALGGSVTALGVATGTIRYDLDLVIADTGSFLTAETDPIFSGSEAYNITATSTSLWNSPVSTLEYPFSTVNSSFTVGRVDAFSRHDIWFTGPSAFLRLGAETVDGDPFDSDSEGFVAFKPSVNRSITLQPEDMRMSLSDDWASYSFMADPTMIAVNSDGYGGNIFSVVRVTSTTYVNGFLRYTDGTQGAGKVLTSDPSGNASWQSLSATIYTIAQMEVLDLLTAGIQITVSNASAPYSVCMSTGGAGGFVLLNQTAHCQ